MLSIKRHRALLWNPSVIKSFKVVQVFPSVLVSLHPTPWSVTVPNVSGWQPQARCGIQVTHITAVQRRETLSPAWESPGEGQLSIAANGSHFCLFFSKRGCSLIHWACIPTCTWHSFRKKAWRPSSDSNGSSNASAITKLLLLEKKNQTSAVAGCYFIIIWVTSGTMRKPMALDKTLLRSYLQEVSQFSLLDWQISLFTRSSIPYGWCALAVSELLVSWLNFLLQII